MLSVTPSINIDESELEERFIRASGPGGQNVNKVATAVQLRFDVANSPSLPFPVKRRLAKIAGNRLTNDGVLIITAKAERTQAKNREAALARLIALLQQAAKPPKKRKKTKPSRAAKERRLEHKRQQSQKKKNRRPVDW